MTYGALYEYTIIFIYFLTSAYNDYKATASTLVFEPSDEIVLEQCLEIEIINDSLPEDWEVFTVLLSTNNSAVNLITHRVDVYITDGNLSIVQDISGQIQMYNAIY